MSIETNHGINYNKFKIDIDESGNSFWYNSDELYFIHGAEKKTTNKKQLQQQRKDGRRNDCALILFGYLCCGVL